MNVTLGKIASILMALIVLFSTSSFWVDMHYCGESLVDFSFFTKAKTCGMEKQDYQSCGTVISQKSCCSDQQIVKEANNELQVHLYNLSFEQQTFVLSIFYTYTNLFEGVRVNSYSFKDYSPPFIERDLHTLYETYLI